MDFLRRHGLAAVLGALLVGAVAFSGIQHMRIVRMEVALGGQWSNDFSGGFFSRLPDLQQALSTWAEKGEVPAEEAEHWYQATHAMLAVVNNRWNDMTGVVPDLPEKPRHVGGYLERVRDSIPRRAERTGTIPLTTEQRAELRRHAQVAGNMVESIKQAYPGYDGGFPSESGYWGRDFLHSAGWRQALTEMDRLASNSMYPPIAGR